MILEKSEPKMEESTISFLGKPAANGLRRLNLHIGLIGVNFKTASIAAREDIARRVTVEKLLQLKASELSRSGCELVLLSTCNRVETYFACERLGNVHDALKHVFLGSTDNGIVDDFKIYSLTDAKAIQHLLEVSAGLDSLVVGEAQILSQVRNACKVANERGLCGPALSKLFAKAYSTGREIRESYPKFTNGFRNSVSLSVSDLISSHFGVRNEKPNVVLVGSGKMIRLAVSAFDKRKFGRIVVAARSQTLKDLEADQVIRLADLAQTISEQDIDVVITATSSNEYVIRPNDVEFFSKVKPDKELLIIDISVPRNVDPRVGKIFRNVTLLNLDDLKDRISASQYEVDQLGEAKADLSSIGISIAVRREEFISWMKESSDITPLMIALRKKAELIRSEELNNALERLTDLTPGQKDVILKMSERIIRRFLHDPTTNLKSKVRGSGDAKSKEYADILKELFSLDLSPSNDTTISTTEGSQDITIF
jgi:glutamyl-tRNA reductase